ncbi:hypothetical protein BASA81_015427 [Batrachochytrium salamandrivorans]|nr:hypothetical protein BASA81_015427 [Batrachochytrium salamandrivorans]
MWASIPQQQWNAPSALEYREMRQVGKGTYGEVFLGENVSTKQVVALKKVSVQHNDLKHRHRGLPLNALREIRLLKSPKCQHPNIVKLLEVASEEEGMGKQDSFCYLVFEYVEHDLAGVLDSSEVELPLPAVKCLFHQLLLALEFLHSHSICHRDLKCSNLLVTSRNVLKLGDFGLARELLENDSRRLSLNVITLWYRAPEVLLGDTKYTTLVDMWSAGCILVELLKRSPLFLGKDDSDQLKKIFSLCGFPSERECPSLAKLPLFAKQIPPTLGGTLSDYFARKQLDADACSLAQRLLEMDPSRRCTAKQALQHQFVTMQCPDPQDLPPIEPKASLHEWETKRKRKDLAAKLAAEEQPPAQPEAPATSERKSSSRHRSRSPARHQQQQQQRRQ